MSAKTSDATLAYATALATEGKRITEITALTGVSSTTLSPYLRSCGFVFSKGVRGPKRKDLPYKRIITDYQVGLGIDALATKFHIGAQAVKNILSKAGLRIRGRSEASSLACRMADPKVRATQLNNARIAGYAAVYKASLDATRTAVSVGIGYHVVRQALQDAGLAVQMQVPYLNYWLDFRIGEVAIEVERSMQLSFFHKDPRVIRLVKAKLAVVYVVHDGEPALYAHMDYIISCIKQVCSNPPRSGQYTVIRCSVRKGTVKTKHHAFSHIFDLKHNKDNPLPWVKQGAV